MAMIPKRQRLRHVVGQGFKTTEVAPPGVFVEIEADPFRPALIEETRLAFREMRRLDRIIKVRPE
jgi:hypothetical protein